MKLAPLLLLSILTASFGCNNAGTCELKFEQSSPDGSIPAGLETCFDDWPADGCEQGKLQSVTLGLATSGYTFTKGARCSDRGYQDCGSRGMLYKVCPDAMAPKEEATAPPGPRPSRPSRPPQSKELGEALPLPDDAPFLGNEAGKTVVQVFFDVQDPFCKRLLPNLRAALAKAPDAKVILRHLPLPYHRDAMLAHQAALEALKQKGNDGFWALVDLMMKNQQQLGRADLSRYAGEAGLDVAAFDAALDGKTHEARVKADVDLATSVGINGTPIMVRDKQILRGTQPERSLIELLTGKGSP